MRLSPLVDVFFPRSCELCGAGQPEAGRYLCWDCRSSFEVIQSPFCKLCGDPVKGAVAHAYTCSFCARMKRGFDCARSAVRFKHGVDELIRSLKYDNALWLSDDLVDLLQACWENEAAMVRPDVIIPVPLHSTRLRGRTFNQAARLGAELGKRLDVEIIPDGLIKIRNTGTQTRLNASQRTRNVAGSFKAGRASWIRGRHVLLVDDVMTTGVTVSACADTLKESCAARVDVVTVARG